MHNNSNATASSSSSLDARGARYRTDTSDTNFESLYMGSSETSACTSLLSPAKPDDGPAIQLPWSPPVSAGINTSPSPSLGQAVAYGGRAHGWSTMTPAISAAAAAAGSPASSSTATYPQDSPAAEAKRVPRPPNAWILYRSNCIQKMRAEMAQGARKPTQADLSKQFGEQWRNESEEVKTSYERLAEAAREEHAQKHPDWKFCRKQAKPSVVKAVTTRQAAASVAAEPMSKRSRPSPYPAPGSRSQQKLHLDDMTSTLPPVPMAELLPRHYAQKSPELPYQGQQIQYQECYSPILPHPQHQERHQHLRQRQQHQHLQQSSVFPVQHVGQYPQHVKAQPQVQLARQQQESLQPLYSVPSMPAAQSFGTQYTFPVAHAPAPTQQQGYAGQQQKPSVRHAIEPRLYTGEGLHDTLARRSSSAIELFNVYKRRQGRGPAQSAMQTSISEAGQSGASQRQGEAARFDSNGFGDMQQQQQQQQQAPQLQQQSQMSRFPQQHHQEQAHQHQHHYSVPQYHTTTKVLPFDSQARSLPAFMPFGMPSSALPQFGFSPQQQQHADGSSSQQSVPSSFQQLDLSQFTWLQPHITSPSESSPTDPSAPGTALPDWLLPFGQVRVRQDDIVGTPLLDFLTEISASANAHAAEAYLQEPMLPSPTGLVAEPIEELRYSPPKEGGGGPSYSFP